MTNETIDVMIRDTRIDRLVSDLYLTRSTRLDEISEFNNYFRYSSDVLISTQLLKL
jgi:hypothetical protein